MTGLCMTPTFKALSALLTYPTEELVAAVPEIAAAIASDGMVSAKGRESLTVLFIDLQTLDLYELQERYVDLFDKTRKLSLHLFEHVHGESRDRGQAMVDLAMLYEKGGLMLAANELPDYLPLFLEYLATSAARRSARLAHEYEPYPRRSPGTARQEGYALCGDLHCAAFDRWNTRRRSGYGGAGARG